MKQGFVCEPGRVAVVREKSVVQQQYEKAGLAVSEADAKWHEKINPWAFVVGVGAPRVTERGTLIETGIKEGMKVLVGEVGRYVEMLTADGSVDFIYVLPFEGVLGRLVHECEKCGWKSEYEPEDGLCPECPRLELPTTQETKLVDMTKKR